MELWLDVDAAKATADRFAAIANTLGVASKLAEREMRSALFRTSAASYATDGQAAHALLTMLQYDTIAQVESFNAVAALSLVVEAATADAAIEAMAVLDTTAADGFDSGQLQSSRPAPSAGILKLLVPSVQLQPGTTTSPNPTLSNGGASGV